MSTVIATVYGTQLVTVVSQGVLGPNGLSAYRVAVDNGFVGTEAEWLDSLKPPFATNAETIAGILTTKAVTPAGVAIIAEKYDVRRSGVVGNGITDDTTQLNAAIATVVAAGGTLFVPPGLMMAVNTGTTAEAVSVSGACHLQFAPGAGMKAIGGTRGLLRITGVGNVKLSGGSFDSNGLVQSSLGIIEINDTSNVVVEDVYVDGVGESAGFGLRVVRVNDLTIERAKVSGRRYGISCQAASAGTTSGLRIKDCDITPATVASAKGIAVDGTASNYLYDDVLISGNSCDIGIAAGTLGIECWRILSSPLVHSNRVKNFAYGLSVANCTYPNVVGNDVMNAASYGVEVASCQGGLVASNTVTNGVIAATGTSDHVSVIGNTIEGTPDTANRHAIHINSAGEAQIIGNMVRANASMTNTPHAIYLQNTPIATVVGNVADGNNELASGITIDYAGAITATILGNQLRDMTVRSLTLISVTSANIRYQGNTHVGANVGLSLASAVISSTSIIEQDGSTALGQRYIELTELAGDAVVPAANAGRLYLKDNGAGKTQMLAKFNTGVVQQIAIEGAGLQGGTGVKAGTLAAIGDSIVQNATTASAWMLLAAYSGKFTQHISAGISGNTSALMLARIQADVIAKGPEWCWLQVTPNDLNLVETTTAAKAAAAIANYKAMVSLLAAAGIKPIFTLSPPSDEPGLSLVRMINAHMGPWCRDQGIPVLDYYAPCADPLTGQWLAGYSLDARHPTQPAVNAFVVYNLALIPPELRALGAGLGSHVSNPYDTLNGAGMFLTDTNADGLGNGWINQVGLAAFSRTAITDRAHGTGFWQNITPPDAARCQIYHPTGALTVGDVYEVSFRVKCTNIGWACRSGVTSFDTPMILGDAMAVVPDITDPGGRLVRVRGIATTASTNLFFGVKGAGGTASFAQVKITNLTAAAALAP